jgi:hypothetical protein
MDCKIIAIAVLKNDFTASVNLSPSLSSTVTLINDVIAIATLKENITQTTSLLDEKLTASTILTNSGINSAPCPIIFCIDGGNAFTTAYPPINGLLNGGSA